jgi:hypothetical protein
MASYLQRIYPLGRRMVSQGLMEALTGPAEARENLSLRMTHVSQIPSTVLKDEFLDIMKGFCGDKSNVVQCSCSPDTTVEYEARHNVATA